MNETYKKTANLVLGYLELRFINLHKEDEVAEKERTLWANELESKIEAERITEQNIVKACDLWADINDNGYPPTVDQFIGCLKKVSFAPLPALADDGDEIDYLKLWDAGDDKQKFRFFIDHPFDKVPAYIRLMFTEYNTKHRGWTGDESKKMIRYHATPFASAEMGAMIVNQREILNYFAQRKAA